MAVELPMKVADILRPLGGMSQTAVLMLLGILDNSSVMLPENSPLIKQIPFNIHQLWNVMIDTKQGAHHSTK